MNAVIYARYSPRPKDKSGDTETIEWQTERCRAYCAAMGLTILAEKSDRDASGKEYEERTGFLAALDLAKSAKAVIVVYNLSRMMRNTKLALAVVDDLDAAGASIASLQERLDTSGPVGRFCLTLLLAKDQLVREMISIGTSDAMRRHQSRGRRMSAKPPYGWRVDVNNPKAIVEDPAEQSAIQHMRALHASGRGLREIGRELESLNVFPRDGAGHRWNHNTIRTILKRLLD